jgi:hypothetical protein
MKNSNRIKHIISLNYFKDFKAELFAFIVHETQSTGNNLELYGLHVWSSICNNVAIYRIFWNLIRTRI